MPSKRRIKRYFVLQTSDGPLVTVNPTPASFLPDSFKTAAVRSLSASRDASGISTGTSGSPTKRGETSVVVPHIHHPGGPILEFAIPMPCPDSFGTPADEEEIVRRERVGTLDRRACALCAHMFDSAKLQHEVSRKAIVEQQAKWGKTNLQEKDLKAANLYDACSVCLFCYQFFEELIRDAPSLIVEDVGRQHHRGGMLSSDSREDGNGSPRSNSNCSGMRPLSSASLSYCGSSATESVQRLAMISAPELQEEERLAIEAKRARRLEEECLNAELEAAHRVVQAVRHRQRLFDYRQSERTKWFLAVEERRLQCEKKPFLSSSSSSPLQETTSSPPPHGILSPSSVPPAAHHDDHHNASAPSNQRFDGICVSMSTTFPQEHLHDEHDDDEEEQLVDEDGHVVMNDELRAILASTPRSSRSQTLLGGPSIATVAKQKLKEQRERRACGNRSSTDQAAQAALSTSNESQKRRTTKSEELRAQATKLSLIRLAEVRLVEEYERRGMSPAACGELQILEDQERSALLELHRLAHRQEGGTRPTTAPGRGVILPSSSGETAAPPPTTTSLLRHLHRGRERRRSAHEKQLESQVHRVHSSLALSEGLDNEAVLKYHGSKRFSMYSL